ncbi:MAG: peroxiredoxin [Phycisphaerae bacterium]|nr:peroxiredoxin [Phycisphaerae bacterium]
MPEHTARPLAPAFALRDQCGRTVRRTDFSGRWLVLYVYPEADTPACTTQACEFQSALTGLASLRAAVAGISPDEPPQLAAFAARFGLSFPLLSDPPGADGVPATIAALGAWGPKVLYGRRSIGLIRTTVIIDPVGRIAARFANVRAKGHAARMASALRSLVDAG